MTSTGSCLCGAVGFTAQGVETEVHACHCSMCRTWTGGPLFGISVQSIEFTGEQNIGRYDSSAWADRAFCKVCGTSLFYRLKEANRHIMSQGSFHDQTPFKLTDEIYIDEKPAGYDFAGDHARLTGAEFMASLSPDG